MQLHQLFAMTTAWLAEPWARWLITGPYLTTLVLLSLFGLHRWRMVWRVTRGRKTPRPLREGQGKGGARDCNGRDESQFARPSPGPSLKGRGVENTALPRVTVQIPLYNEATVAERVIDAVCGLDWPRDRLEVQVLDDSDDEASLAVSRQRVAHWARRGVDITWRHRDTRDGYKAGALAEGVREAKGAFFAVFDADFVPPPDWLRRVMPCFADAAVGVVQTRWEHLNRETSLLTRCEAMCLDAHFAIEHASRQAARRWLHFNGTAGVWRRETIEQAGGWNGDTLSEDVDLSYRAQLAGWRFVYLDDVVAPAALPTTMSAFKSQQHRWSKGLVQVAMKLLPRIARASAPLGHKVEAALHLLSPVTHVLMLLMVLLMYPAMRVSASSQSGGAALGALLGLTLLVLGAGSAGAFYVAGQRVLRRGAWAAVVRLPLLMAIGVGMSINNARGVMEAIIGHRSPFIRTPKAPGSAGGPSAPTSADNVEQCDDESVQVDAVPRRSRGLWRQVALETMIATYLVACAHAAIDLAAGRAIVPFLLLFAGGFAYVAWTTIWPTAQRTSPHAQPFGLAAKRQSA